jgi:hypothetical protein
VRCRQSCCRCMMSSATRRQKPIIIAPTRRQQLLLGQKRAAASAAGAGPEQLLLGQLPPQRGVLGAQHGVVAAQAGHLAVAPVRGVALPPAGLPGERLGGAAPAGLAGVGLDELGEVGHPEDEVQRAEVVHPVRREVGGQLAVGLALAPLVLAHRARAAAAAGHPAAAVRGGGDGTERELPCVAVCVHIWIGRGPEYVRGTRKDVQDSKVKGGSRLSRLLTARVQVSGAWKLLMMRLHCWTTNTLPGRKMKKNMSSPSFKFKIIVRRLAQQAAQLLIFGLRSSNSLAKLYLACLLF